MSASDRPEDISPGDKVAWNWGSSHIEGIASEIYTEPVSKEIKGKTISRNGTDDNPAVFVTREEPGRNPVLKKATELHVLDADENPPSTEHVRTRAQARRAQEQE